MKKAICPICKKEVTISLDMRFWAHGEITEQTEPGTMDWCPMSDKPSDDRGWWFRDVRSLPRHKRADYVVEQFQADRITDWQLWDILSHHNGPIPATDAATAFFQLGFEPFSGYPLTERKV